MAAAAVFAVEEAGEMSLGGGGGSGSGSDGAGAVAADVLEALVELLQPGAPAQRQLAAAIAGECGGAAVVLAPLSRPHAATRALAIRLLAALLPRTLAGGGGGGGSGGAGGLGISGGIAPGGSSGNLERLAAAPSSFVNSISSTLGGKSTGGAGSGGAGGNSKFSTLQAPPGLFAAVSEALLCYPLTHDIRAALFELMLGGQPVPALETPVARKGSAGIFGRGAKAMAKAAGGAAASAGKAAATAAVSAAGRAAGRIFGSSASTSSSSAAAYSSHGSFGGALLAPGVGASSSGVPGIVHAAAAGLLLRLLDGCDDTEMRAGVLELLLRLVEGAAANAHALLGQAGWQEWLMPMLRRDVGARVATATEIGLGGDDEAAAAAATAIAADTAARDEERGLALRLLRALHAHAVLRTHGGAAEVEASAAAVAAAGARGVLDGTALLRTLVADLWEALIEQDPALSGGGMGGLTPNGSGNNDSWTIVERPALSAAPCGDNLWALLPLVDTMVAEASPAGALDTSASSSGRVGGGGAVDEEGWRMLDGTWRILEALAHPPEVAPRAGGGGGGGGHSQQSLSGDGGGETGVGSDDFEGRSGGGGGGGGDDVLSHTSAASRKKAVAQRALLQRVAFRLVLVYIYEAPVESAAAAAAALQALLPALLAQSAAAATATATGIMNAGGENRESGGGGGERACTSARLHLFLAALVRVEGAFMTSAPERACIAERLVGAAAAAGKGLLVGGMLQGGVISVGGGAYAPGFGGAPIPVDSQQAGAFAAAVMVSAGSGAAGGGLRGLISEQKAAAAAAEEAREGRRMSEARRSAAATASRATADADARECAAERALREHRRASLASLCDRERQRRALARAAHEEEAQTLDRRWLNLQRELTGESGPWAAPTGGAEASSSDSGSGSGPCSASGLASGPNAPLYKWKLDKSEDSSQRCLRLKRNYHWVAYRDDRALGRTASALAGHEGSGTAGGGGGDDNDAISKAVGAIRRRGASAEGEAEEEDEAAARAEAEATAAATAAAAAEAEREAAELSREDRRKVLLSVPGTLVSAKRTVTGRVDISRAAVHFTADKEEDSTLASSDGGGGGGASTSGGGRGSGPNSGELPKSKKRFWRWPTARIDEVHHARYRLQNVAVEIFLTDRRSAFLAFSDRRAAREVAARIAASRPGVTLMDRRRKLEAAARAQERWRRRDLSTFDYLMALNTLAGRTRNDLTQYPVFPWVLSDYTSPEVDLNDPKVFRDLAKPVGALHPPRLRQFIERYQLLAEDPDALAPPFHYGSHYSSSGTVLFFLLRLEPFTALGRQLQGGRFDHADRVLNPKPQTRDPQPYTLRPKP
jgi:hypothetical protein